jgi:hypothetical protein
VSTVQFDSLWPYGFADVQAVFKKFEKENLFQIMCAGESFGSPATEITDIVERFQLGLMLSVIALRNMIEMAGSDIAFLPKSFVRGKSLVDAILSVSRRAAIMSVASDHSLSSL